MPVSKLHVILMRYLTSNLESACAMVVTTGQEIAAIANVWKHLNPTRPAMPVNAAWAKKLMPMIDVNVMPAATGKLKVMALVSAAKVTN